ncbi:adventurous gliding motility lipoprotein CglD [Corallococcus carmarthensis]|uniref:adventurous gliding motility lipoprotein CglD n=1 Tax=Corallococcus carmarthensis TaxID=2316728 RepID=UPI00148E3FA4|nr:adventurous gliding motility lipoprotein CglD [Corallococcus carmarthensis]NOK16610.1 VWA domain-containing protein [Corallococcus carmarthensis]
MRNWIQLFSGTLLAALLVTGCGGTDPDPGPGTDPNPTTDAGPDSGTDVDAGFDAGYVEDAGVIIDPDPDPGEVTTDPYDPNNATKDSDCDGLTDQEEFSTVYTGGVKTNPGLRDTDGDGIRDGVEVGRTSSISTDPSCNFRADQDPTTRTSPVKADTDEDGLPDGLEDANRNGKRDLTETDPNTADSDGDGLADGVEDANKNGSVSPGETDPRLRDTDGDGLPDGLEKQTGTDPLNPDTDGDTCSDGAEDVNKNGKHDSGEKNPRVADCAASVPDADFDGIPDSVENATGTNPNKADTDGDGVADGVEDSNKNGRVEPGETDPRLTDTDCDGLQDGAGRDGFLGEDPNSNGQVDPGESDPSNPDTDGDGLLDGVERGVTTAAAPRNNCGYSGDADPTTKTDPNKPDSDGDGIPDGAEDSNQNGRVDPGELNPLDPKDGAATTPAGKACSVQNLRTVTFKEDSGADLRLALPNTFKSANLLNLTAGGQTVGVMGWDDTKQVTFIAYKRGQVGTSTTPAGDEQGIRSGAALLTAADVEFTQTFTTWDGFPAAVARYGVTGTTELKAFTNSLARQLVPASTENLGGSAGINGPFKIQAQYVHRSNGSVVVVLAITPAARYNESATGSLFTMADTAGGSALAQFGDADAVQCEVFTGNTAVVDFLFVVDDSGSMASSQTFLAGAAAAVANKLANATLDWRLGMVTTAYTGSGPNNGVLRSFTQNIDQFKSWLTQNAVCNNTVCAVKAGTAQNPTYTPLPNTTCASDKECWVGLGGDGAERSLEAARKAINDLTATGGTTATRIRPGAKVVVIILTDTRDQSASTVADYTAYFLNTGTTVGTTKNPVNAPIQLHGIICPPDGARCNKDEDNTNPRHLDVIQNTGGVSGSIRDNTSITNTINAIVDSVIASVGYKTLKPPIGASMKVAVAEVADAAVCPSIGDLPRSRTNGFDVDGINRTVSFYGACRPKQSGVTQAAVSYRYWIDRTAKPDGNPPPCASDTQYYNPNDPDYCDGKLVCNRTTDRCECPADCGGTAPAGQVCNTDRDVCDFSCAPDCGGTCGTFETCNTNSCSCSCVQSASCAAGYKFDNNACGCVCDTAALNCGTSFGADPGLCACVCKPDCGGCAPGFTCNVSACVCEKPIG